MRTTLTFLAAIAVLGLAGCETPLAYDPTFGQAKTRGTDAMIANPGASEQATGIAGPTAEGVMDNYHYNEEAQNQQKRHDDQADLKVEF